MIVAVGFITPLQLPGLAAEGSSSSQPPGYSLPTAIGPGSKKKSVRKFLNVFPRIRGFEGFFCM